MPAVSEAAAPFSQGIGTGRKTRPIRDPRVTGSPGRSMLSCRMPRPLTPKPEEEIER